MGFQSEKVNTCIILPDSIIEVILFCIPISRFFLGCIWRWHFSDAGSKWPWGGDENSLPWPMPPVSSAHPSHLWGHRWKAEHCMYVCMVKNLPAMQETWVWSLGQEDPLEKGRATHSSILAWRIPWREEPSRLQSVGLQRVGHWGLTLSVQFSRSVMFDSLL